MDTSQHFTTNGINLTDHLSNSVITKCTKLSNDLKLLHYQTLLRHKRKMAHAILWFQSATCPINLSNDSNTGTGLNSL